MATYTVILDTNDTSVTVGVNRTLVIETGVQGPPGETSRAIVQDFEPTSGVLGDLWFNDNTQSLTVYAQSTWMNQAMDGGYY